MLSFYFVEQKYKKKKSSHLLPRIEALLGIFDGSRDGKMMEKLQKRKGTRGNKVKRLRKDDCRKWWGTVIRLTGSSGNALSYSLECDREVLNEMALADILCFCG